PITPRRAQDRAVTGDFTGAIVRYAMGEFDGLTAEIPLQTVDRIIAIGNHKFLRAIREAIQSLLKDYLIKQPRMLGSVYGPMQCMLKGVCAQCLSWQIDPHTGKRTKAVFSCSWHDQP